jgi:hypothetical protein
MELNMQNKPNFQNTQMNVSPVPTETYRELPPRRHPQNKPNQTQYKAIFNPSAPLQSQNKPKQTQFHFRPSRGNYN